MTIPGVMRWASAMYGLAAGRSFAMDSRPVADPDASYVVPTNS